MADNLRYYFGTQAVTAFQELAAIGGGGNQRPDLCQERLVAANEAGSGGQPVGFWQLHYLVKNRFDSIPGASFPRIFV